MIKISKVVEEIIQSDDLVLSLASRGLLNVSAYAREIKSQIEEKLIKKVKEGSISTAINRYIANLPKQNIPQKNIIQSLSVHSNLEGVSYERTDKTSEIIGKIYNTLLPNNKTFLTVTQGINEITIVAEKNIAQRFIRELKNIPTIYEKSGLVGITVKFDIKYLEIPNLLYALTRRLAMKDINIIEVVSTATEITFIVEKKDLETGLSQLQKNI